jgi:hypothetical protein
MSISKSGERPARGGRDRYGGRLGSRANITTDTAAYKTLELVIRQVFGNMPVALIC